MCLQNGVANESAALRRFANVYGICVMLPASHLEPGLVVAHSAPVPGILDVGRFPDGVDDTADARWPPGCATPASTPSRARTSCA